MIIKIYREQEGHQEHVGTFSETVNDDYRGIYAYLEKKCAEIFGGKSISMPCLVLYSNPDGKSTFRIRKGNSTGHEERNHLVMSPETAAEDHIQMTDIVYEKDGKEVTEKFGAELFYNGFVIRTGVTGCNMFGHEAETYVAGIGSKRARSGWKSYAKRFATAAAARDFVKRHESAFRYLAGTAGWKPKVMYASEAYKEYFLLTSTARKAENAQKALDEANAILDRYVKGAVTSVRENGSSAKEEALFRMQDLNMMKTVMKKFVAGTLMMSEFGGILYDLDEEARAAVKEVEEKGLLPYHVVKTQTTIGTMYAVLYVSPNPGEWDIKRYDPATGEVTAYVANGIFSEFGTVVIKPCNGGLARTA